MNFKRFSVFFKCLCFWCIKEVLSENWKNLKSTSVKKKINKGFLIVVCFVNQNNSIVLKSRGKNIFFIYKKEFNKYVYYFSV